MNPENVHYKWSKLLASIAHNRGSHKLTPVEAQELLDDIKSSEINWKELRSKFFDKCTDKDANGNSLPKVNITPSNLFEWFKNEINNY